MDEGSAPLYNRGNGPLRVPGFANFPVEYETDDAAYFGVAFVPTGSRHAVWEQDPRLTVREIAMLDLMSRLTDEPDWNKAVFQEDVVLRWREEQIRHTPHAPDGQPLITERVWQWCIEELQDKAATFEKTGYVLALDSGSRVSKADSLVSSTIRDQLAQDVQELLSPTNPSLSSHQEILVDPLLYSLVYGRTDVLAKGGQVSLDGLFDLCGHCEVAPKHTWDCDEPQVHSRDLEDLPTQASREFRSTHYPMGEAAKHVWSRRFQRLPCEFEFSEGFDNRNQGRITSYINNLHPAHCKGIYGYIENILTLAIPCLNDILILNDKPRSPPRIRTYGAREGPDLPDWAQELVDPEKPWDSLSPAIKEKVVAYLAMPDYGPPIRRGEPPDDDDSNWEIGDDWEEEYGLTGALFTKLARLRREILPEPGVSFSFTDWKTGKTANPVISRADSGIFRAGNDSDHEYYPISLQDTFANQGLQVIVSIASLQLCPEDPTIPDTDWRFQGTMNEHIVATVIYYFGVENISTGSCLRFRQDTYLDLKEQNEYEPLLGGHELIATIFGIPDNIDIDPSVEPTLQDLGSVSIRQGRLVTFPNALEYKTTNVQLADPSRPGHLRYLMLELVDPHYRLCSTRNIPPQQHDWWAEAALGQVDWAGKDLPQEILDKITEGLDSWPMGDKEAVALRAEFASEVELCQKVIDLGHGFHWHYR